MFLRIVLAGQLQLGEAYRGETFRHPLHVDVDVRERVQQPQVPCVKFGLMIKFLICFMFFSINSHAVEYGITFEDMYSIDNSDNPTLKSNLINFNLNPNLNSEANSIINCTNLSKKFEIGPVTVEVLRQINLSVDSLRRGRSGRSAPRPRTPGGDRGPEQARRLDRRRGDAPHEPGGR